ncbi:MAG: hypothetical protein ACT4PT_12120 [Methanobacteriota archaeon]
MTRTTYPSTRCTLCDTVHDRRSLGPHLAECVASYTAYAKRAPADAFHVEVESDNWATGATYWLHVLAKADATLFDLDALLRKTWLEPCCGHMSAFEAGSVRFEAYPDDEFGPPAEAMGGYPLRDVLKPRKTLDYEYDFGSTTHLRLRALGRAHVAIKGRARVQLLARNPPPPLTCGSCGKPATRVCTVGCEAPEALTCAGCAREHECGEDMMSEIVNSPRTGVCGYPTEPLNEKGGWVKAK